MAKSKYRPKPTWNVPAAQTQASANTGPIRLSQCMIVKNEEDDIERALSWGRDIMCEQIVVDTGSTDRTVEIAERMGAKVYHFKWINDFSAAKNYAIEQAKGNWIAFCDADEYLDEKSVAALKQFLAKANANAKGNAAIVRSKLVNYDDDGTIFHFCTQGRFFTNHPKLRYVGAIHEDLYFLGEKSTHTVYDATAEITIHHTGYASKTVAAKAKGQRNIEALRAELEKNPNEIVYKGYLAESLRLMQQLDESTPLFEEVVNTDPSQYYHPHFNNIYSNAFRYLMDAYSRTHEPLDKIEALHKKAVEAYPDIPDVDYYMGNAIFYYKDYERALPYYLEAEKKCDAYNGILPSDAANFLASLYQRIAICYENLANPTSATRYAVLALKRAPYDQTWLTAFISSVTGGKYAESAEATLRLLRNIYDLTKLKDKLILLKAAKSIGNDPLYTLVYAEFTAEEKTWFESK